MAAASDPDAQQPPSDGLSLRELSDAFARAMGERRPMAEPQTSAPDEVTSDETFADKVAGSLGDSAQECLEPPVDVGGTADEDPCEVTPASILEAMLFVGNRTNEPLSSQRAAELMRGVAPEEVPDLVEQLNRRYAARGCPYEILGEGDGYRMSLRHEFWPIRNRFYGRIREARLSQAAIDVLAIVAYRQPVTADQVNQYRGRPCNHLLGQLVHRRLLRVERTGEKPRITRYFTSERFLTVFGLETLSDLPRSDDDVDTK